MGAYGLIVTVAPIFPPLCFTATHKSYSFCPEVLLVETIICPWWHGGTVIAWNWWYCYIHKDLKPGFVCNLERDRDVLSVCSCTVGLSKWELKSCLCQSGGENVLKIRLSPKWHRMRLRSDVALPFTPEHTVVFFFNYIESKPDSLFCFATRLPVPWFLRQQSAQHWLKSKPVSPV